MMLIMKINDFVILNRIYSEVETGRLYVGINGLFVPQNAFSEPLPGNFSRFRNILLLNLYV